MFLENLWVRSPDFVLGMLAVLDTVLMLFTIANIRDLLKPPVKVSSLENAENQTATIRTTATPDPQLVVARMQNPKKINTTVFRATLVVAIAILLLAIGFMKIASSNSDQTVVAPPSTPLKTEPSSDGRGNETNVIELKGKEPNTKRTMRMN